MKFNFKRPWQIEDRVFYVGRHSPTGDDCIRSGKIIKKSEKAKGWWLVRFFGGAIAYVYKDELYNTTLHDKGRDTDAI